MTCVIGNHWTNYRQNRALRICINNNEHIPWIKLHQGCKIVKLEAKRIVHLCMFMHKQCNKELIVDRRNINTRAQDALFMQL